MPTHPDAEIQALLTGDAATYQRVQAGGSAWSRGSQYGSRAVDYAREACKVLETNGFLPDAGHRVCCAGCNDGLEVEEFARQGYVAEGFDLDPEKVRVGQALGLKVKVGDLAQPPFSEGIYAGVFCSHTLEHARDLVAACKALAALLLPGGALYLVVPVEPAFPAHNPAHTSFITSPQAVLQHFPGWGLLEPRQVNNPEPQAILVLRKPEEATT